MQNFRNIPLFFVVLTSAGLSACGLTEKSQNAVRASSTQLASLQLTSDFATINQKIIQPKCVTCHSASLPSGGFDFSNYAAVMASGSVVAGSPGASTFYTSVSTGLMPQGSTLSTSEIQAISQWIQSGALNSGPAPSPSTSSSPLPSPSMTPSPSPTPVVPPALTSITPTTGSTAGGTLIKLTGTGFKPTGMVITLGGTPCSSVNVTSTTLMNCITGAHASAVVDVTIADSSGATSTLTRAFTYQAPAVAPPVLSSISPSSGSTSGGTAVTLTGSGFNTGALVSIGSVACSGAAVASSTKITCSTGAHAAGAATVTVLNPDSQTSSVVGGYTYITPATFSSVNQLILAPKCLSCHGGSMISKGVDYSSYTKAVGTGSVVPGNPSGSTMYTQTSNGSMPKGLPNLTAAELKLINDWIAAGAPNN